VDRKHAQAIEQVGAEGPIDHLICEVALRSSNQADVGLASLRTAEPLEFAFLQHPQQRHLHVGGQLADFIEKQRGTVGLLEAADASLDRAGERAGLMPERLGRHQRVRNRADVDGDQRPTAALRQPMDGTRHQFLAGAGLSRDQHGGVGRSDTFDTVAGVA